MDQHTQFSSKGRKKSGMLLTFMLSGCLMSSSLAQTDVIQVMKNGTVVFQSDVSEIDRIIFDSQNSSTDMLVVNKKDGSPVEKAFIDDISQVSLQTGNLQVVPKTGSAKLSYPIAAVSSLNFEEGDMTDVNTPAAASGMNVYFSPQGEIIVQTGILVHSLTLLGMEGKILGKSRSNVLSTSHLPAGIYLLRVETAQGTVVKKVMNHSNIR